MIVKKLMSMRFCLSLGAALAVSAVLVDRRDGPPPNPEGAGIIYVYFPSLCANPGDSRDCKELPVPTRPAFSTMAACSAHADAELKAQHNPRVMASCMKEREG